MQAPARLWPWFLGTAGALSLSAFVWRFFVPLLRGPPQRTIVVQEIVIYPLKGAKGISVMKAALGKFGFKCAHSLFLLYPFLIITSVFVHVGTP